jgi:lipopolysaccharide transport system permease protein
MSTTHQEYEVEIRPRQGWIRFDFRSLHEFRDLFFLLVRRDFVVKYKQTILGPLWFLIQPLLTTLVFTVIFGGVAKISTDGIPPLLFYLTGLTIWSYFSQCFNSAALTFINNSPLFSKVYFPRLIVPLSTTTSSLVALGVQFLCLFGFYLYFLLVGANIHLSWQTVFVVPLLVIQCGLLALGCGLLFSAFTVKYADLVHLLAFGLQIWMYASPIVYPASRVHGRFEWLLWLNPAAPMIENFRASILGTGYMPFGLTCASIAWMVLIFLAGTFSFQKAERTFVDTI